MVNLLSEKQNVFWHEYDVAAAAASGATKG
jgi:hypothetical protein